MKARMISYMSVIAVLALFACAAGWPALALAADAGPEAASTVVEPAPDASTADPGIADSIRAAYSAGGWLAVAGAAVALGVAWLRPRGAVYLARKWDVDWLESPFGGYAFTAATAFLACLSAALASGAGFSWSMLWGCAVTTAAALGLTPGQDARTTARVNRTFGI